MLCSACCPGHLMKTRSVWILFLCELMPWDVCISLDSLSRHPIKQRSIARWRLSRLHHSWNKNKLIGTNFQGSRIPKARANREQTKQISATPLFRRRLQICSGGFRWNIWKHQCLAFLLKRIKFLTLLRQVSTRKTVSRPLVLFCFLPRFLPAQPWHLRLLTVTVFRHTASTPVTISLSSLTTTGPLTWAAAAPGESFSSVWCDTW